MALRMRRRLAHGSEDGEETRAWLAPEKSTCGPRIQASCGCAHEREMGTKQQQLPDSSPIRPGPELGRLPPWLIHCVRQRAAVHACESPARPSCPDPSRASHRGRLRRPPRRRSRCPRRRIRCSPPVRRHPPPPHTWARAKAATATRPTDEVAAAAATAAEAEVVVAVAAVVAAAGRAAARAAEAAPSSAPSVPPAASAARPLFGAPQPEPH